MKIFFNKIANFMRKSGCTLFASIFIVVSILFFAITQFGISNSSLCSLENKCHSIKEDSGSNIHIRYFLSDENEAKRKSAISQVNSFNDYRLKELGRNVSFVKNENFTINFEENVLETSTITYGDIYSERLTTSYLGLQIGKFIEEEFSDEHSIYISSSIVDAIPTLNFSNAVGSKVTLSFDDEQEFIIRGIITTGGTMDSGIHIKHLFGDKFILMNSKNVYKYDFTDLMFGSSDYHFVDDLKDFEKKIGGSYLDYSAIKMRTSSIYENNIDLSEVFYFESVTNTQNVLIAVFSILGLLLVLVFDCLYMCFYDFAKDSIYEKIIVFILITFWSFGPLVGGLLFALKGTFVARTVIGLLTFFAAFNLLTFLIRFVGFSKKKTEEQNNG